MIYRVGGESSHVEKESVVRPREQSFPKFIVVAGGVISGVGKGLATASIGRILQEYGFDCTAIKIDP